MVKTVLSLLIGVLMLGTLASCMDDPITTNEAVPQNIYRPNSVGFRFVNYVPGSPTGSIRVYWSNSSSDLQKNFGGYVARILTFDSVMRNGVMVLQSTTFAQQIVSKTTFEAIFDNVPVNKEYVFAVWGMRNPDPAKPDSLILSRDSATPAPPKGNSELRYLFDPRPLKNPTVIRAASTGPTSVLLNWDIPSTHSQGNILSYAVYYRDPSRLNDSAKFLQAIPFLDSNSVNTNSITVSVASTATGAGQFAERELEYWVKVIRTDSTQFYDDSTLIRWSGGERLSMSSTGSDSGAIHLGKALTIGKNLQARFAVEERDADNELAWIKFEDAGDNILLTGLHGTKFYITYHEEERLDVAKFTRPLQEAEFDQETLTIPKATAKGWNVYARLFGSHGEPLRVHLATSGTSIVSAINGVKMEMIYQPERVETVPPYPYF